MMTQNELKALIAEKIKTNETGDITAAVLANILKEIVNRTPDCYGVLSLLMNQFHLDIYNPTADEKAALNAGKIDKIEVNGTYYSRVVNAGAVLNYVKNVLTQKDISLVYDVYGNVAYDAANPSSVDGMNVFIVGNHTTYGTVIVSAEI